MRKRRVIIFQEEPVIKLLLESIFSRRGYEVLSFNEPVICPVYESRQEERFCLKEHPCSDIVITDQRLPSMTGIELLRRQSTHGCKLMPMNKAVLSAYLTESEQKDLCELGGHFISTPFHLADLTRWIEECEKRMDVNVPLAIRRKEKRMPVQVAVFFRTETMDKILDGTVTDISRSGFCLSTDRPFDPAETVRLVSDIPYTCSVASARWSKTTESGKIITGFSCD